VEIRKASFKFSEELGQLKMKALSLCGGRDGSGGDREGVAGLGSLQDLCNIEEELREVKRRIRDGTNGFKVGEVKGQMFEDETGADSELTLFYVTGISTVLVRSFSGGGFFFDGY